MQKKLLLLLVLLLFGLGMPQATSIIGGSSLITTSNVSQLETWLGETNLALTKIFSKSANGASAAAFHSHADNQGRTFTLIEIINGSDTRIVGGYYSRSWSSVRSYDRSAGGSFLFNLTSSTLYSHSRFDYYAYDDDRYGPTWGGGHDLYINNTLSGGYANIGHDYGDPGQYGQAAYRNAFTGSYSSWTVGGLEVFTIAEDQAPEPASLALLCIALAAVGITRKK